MKSTLDCMACFVRQAIDAARMAVAENALHERILRDVLRWVADMDLNAPPPMLAQRIHRRLREISGVNDPYFKVKEATNRMALELLPELEIRVRSAPDSLQAALRAAIAGNVIDLGVNSTITGAQVHQALQQAITAPLCGSMDNFTKAANQAGDILYLADNAGEIVFDRLLIEQLGPERVTVVVRGAPVLNDATMDDARTAGLHELVAVMDNGSDAPATLLDDCSNAFIERFESADMIIAKGQGNFESLGDVSRRLFFIFKVKCGVVADHVGQPLGTHMLFNPSDGA